MSETDRCILNILKRKGKFKMHYYEYLLYIKLTKMDSETKIE